MSRAKVDAGGPRLPHDFDYAILNDTAHRPWPMPDRPWVMTQTWTDLLFAHWPIDARVLAPKIPPAIPLDLFEGRAWIGIVPFRMTNVAPRGVPALPWVSAFPELNVRTYVRIGHEPGVFFFSLDAANPLAVATAWTLFHLPYYTASMSMSARDDRVEYRSRRLRRNGVRAEWIATYGPTGPAFEPQPGTLEYFLTERYCLYTTDRRSRVLRLDVHHPPWPLQPAAADIRRNTMAEAAGIALPAIPPLLHFSKRQDVVTWWSERV